jgi:hypothetical protein
MLLHHDIGIQIDNSGIGHGDLAMDRRTSTKKLKTNLGEKTMWRRRLTVAG